MATKKAKFEKENLMQYGSIIFGVGLLVAVIAAFFSLSENATKMVFVTLALIGIIIGILNIRNDEANSFLLASITLVILSGPFLGLISQYLFKSPVVNLIFGNLIALIVPAAIIVSLKVLFLTAKDE